jgi:starch synthase (maltosyl-transferring)
VDDIHPSLAYGAQPSKAVVGETVPITATIYRDGHHAIGAYVVWRDPDGRPRPPARMTPAGQDRFRAEITPDREGLWTFAVESFGDPYRTWRDAVQKKLDAGQGQADLANDLAEGAELLERAAQADGMPPSEAARVRLAADALRDKTQSLGVRVSAAISLGPLLWTYPVRELVSAGAERGIRVDRERALFSAWYELFPRSEGAKRAKDGSWKSGTFKTAARRLPGVAAMGFDVVYLPPIHPIGRINRKGRNNALVAGPDDVGSPWAIGAAEGGHDAIHPDLGTMADFQAFLAAARELGMEVALDLALQCAPDHPWVGAHPEWFTTRADGTIAYAENPPKKYQDIYPVNFDNDPEPLRAEILRVVRHWVDAGVRIFRVDNPHTKPFDFWEWLIAEVKATDPDVLFLAEAFTRPALMHGLGTLGFTQSYTYFTWRTTAWEMREYCQELVDSVDHMRPNFWPNTPDILHESLQHGGPPMFKIRAVLASMLTPSWGLYAGYELYEHVARPGAEEYVDNEKYELKPRDWAAAEAAGQSLAPYLTALNRVRRDNPALRRLRNLRFHAVDNEQMLCFSKRDEATGNTVIVVCLMDSQHAHWGNTSLDMPALGFDWHERFAVRDELTGVEYDWGQHNAVHLDPFVEPAHVFTVHRRAAVTAPPPPPVVATAKPVRATKAIKATKGK